MLCLKKLGHCWYIGNIGIGICWGWEIPSYVGFSRGFLNKASTKEAYDTTCITESKRVCFAWLRCCACFLVFEAYRNRCSRCQWKNRFLLRDLGSLFHWAWVELIRPCDNFHGFCGNLSCEKMKLPCEIKTKKFIFEALPSLLSLRLWILQQKCPKIVVCKEKTSKSRLSQAVQHPIFFKGPQILCKWILQEASRKKSHQKIRLFWN